MAQHASFDTATGNPDLLETLRHAMHAMAQPITALQARFYLAEAASSDAAPHQAATSDVLQAASVDLSELSMLFRLSQELLRVSSVTHCPAPAPVPVSDFAAALAEDAEVILAGKAVSFRVDPPKLPNSAGTAVLVNLASLRQACAHAVAGYRDMGGPPAVLTLGLAAGKGIFRCSLSLDRFLDSGQLSDQAPLRLAIARAGLRAQHIAFTSTSSSILFELPIADPALSPVKRALQHSPARRPAASH